MGSSLFELLVIAILVVFNGVFVAAEIALLPQRHSDLWAVFQEVANKRDLEALQVGDAFEHEVRLEATDVLAMMLPAMKASPQPGLAAYPSPPRLDNSSNRGAARATLWPTVAGGAHDHDQGLHARDRRAAEAGQHVLVLLCRLDRCSFHAAFLHVKEAQGELAGAAVNQGLNAQHFGCTGSTAAQPC